MLGAGAALILGGREEAVVTARRGVGMIVPVTLSRVIAPTGVAVVIIPMLIPMIIRAHGLMIIRAMLVRTILRTDQRRSQCSHRESCQGE